jgi:hypothetical protein
MCQSSHCCFLLTSHTGVLKHFVHIYMSCVHFRIWTSTNTHTLVYLYTYTCNVTPSSLMLHPVRLCYTQFGFMLHPVRLYVTPSSAFMLHPVRPLCYTQFGIMLHPVRPFYVTPSSALMQLKKIYIYNKKYTFICAMAYYNKSIVLLLICTLLLEWTKGIFFI